MVYFGILFLAVGVWYTFFPKSVFALKIKQGRFLGIKLSGGIRAYATLRITGIVLIVLGLMMIFIK